MKWTSRTIRKWEISWKKQKLSRVSSSWDRIGGMDQIVIFIYSTWISSWSRFGLLLPRNALVFPIARTLKSYRLSMKKEFQFCLSCGDLDSYLNIWSHLSPAIVAAFNTLIFAQSNWRLPVSVYIVISSQTRKEWGGDFVEWSAKRKHETVSMYIVKLSYGYVNSNNK